MSERLIRTQDFTADGGLHIENTGEDLNVYLQFSEKSTAENLHLDLVLHPHSNTRVFCKISTATHIQFNARLKKNATAKFYGLTELTGNAAAAIGVNVYHDEGENLTEQNFYSYAADTSQIKFTGRITVAPGASGAVAHQLHRGIALSPTARINAEPFLQIMHDDVRCTHGSTIGFIDQEARHYLMARGIDSTEAERLLIYSSQRQFYTALGAKAAAEFFGIEEETL